MNPRPPPREGGALPLSYEPLYALHNVLDKVFCWQSCLFYVINSVSVHSFTSSQAKGSITKTFQWARGGSNSRPSPCEVSKSVKTTLEKLSEDVIKEYLEYRFAKIKSEKSRWWIKKTVEELFNFTKGKLTRNKLLKFQNWYKKKYEYEGQIKFHDNSRNFLEWLYKKTGSEEYRKLKEIFERPKRDSKKLNPILIREPDIHNLIKAVWETNLTDFAKIRFTTAVLFGAYTGQRPDATSGKLTFEEIEEALSRSPPILWIPEDKDKENFPHWVPLHPVVVEWLKKLIQMKDQTTTDKIFPYDQIRVVFDKINVKAVHTNRKITYSHLRKFFEQMCNNVLMVHVEGGTVPAMHPGLRDYIMAHNTGSLDVQSYDGKLPVEIYDQYMTAWKDVDLVPKNLQIKAIFR